MVHPYSSIDTATAWKNFILSDNFSIIDSLSIAVNAFSRRMLTSLSVDEILLLRYVNLFTNFRGLLLKVAIALFPFKHTNSVLFSFTWMPMPSVACSRLCSRDSFWACVFVRRARSDT